VGSCIEILSSICFTRVPEVNRRLSFCQKANGCMKRRLSFSEGQWLLDDLFPGVFSLQLGVLVCVQALKIYLEYIPYGETHFLTSDTRFLGVHCADSTS